tara:strand:+ start:3020 stop:3874 length:855 start_codon:yes stop_codon:yes gene_type:complete
MAKVRFVDSNIKISNSSGNNGGNGGGTVVIANPGYNDNNTTLTSIKIGSNFYKIEGGNNNNNNGIFIDLNNSKSTENNLQITGSLKVSSTVDVTGAISASEITIGEITGSEDPLPIKGNVTINTNSTEPEQEVFKIVGSEGTLFTIDDDLEGMLFTANNKSGHPILQASASGEVWIGKSPQSLYTTAIISATTPNTDNVIISMRTGSYDGAFFEYTAISESHARAGNISSIWNKGLVEFAESSTLDIGDTADLNFEVKLNGGEFQLCSYDESGGYRIKTITKVI